MAIISLPTKKEQRFQALCGTKNKRQDYEKMHSYKSSKEIWDTFTLAYKGVSQMLVHQYELFKIEDNEIIYLMLGRFQTIVNNLTSLRKTYYNYDHITKILRSLPKSWRPQVTALQASKDLMNTRR
ncbi:hypothetical protein CR513_13137, partial [Mucuna pruriens]